MAGKYFRVKNLEKFQHYKDRNPPWIKFHNTLLDNYEFGCLPDASKAHLSLIWLLASRHENKLPWDERWIQERIGAKSKVNLNIFITYGFIELIPNASNTLADDKQSALLDRGEDINRDRGETETEAEKVPASPDWRVLRERFKEFWSAYPKKASREKSEKAWFKIKPDEQLHNVIMQSLERAKTSAQWQKDGGEFIPHPSTWLNGKRWEDEYTVNGKPKSTFLEKIKAKEGQP